MKNVNKEFCGFVAIVGASNVGKSTLLNKIIGTKVSIVSSKLQTTRTRVLGIAIFERTQLIFVDTPGIFSPKTRLDRAMVTAAWRGFKEADSALLIVDAVRGIDFDTKNILKELKYKGIGNINLVINKIDLVKKEKLLVLSSNLNKSINFNETYMISATKGDGVCDLIRNVKSEAPIGPWLFPQDQISDMPMRLFSAELTREKLFKNLHQELPYSVTVETELWEERPDGSTRIEQTIYVERKSQRSIVIGQDGKMIKLIGKESRKEISEMLDNVVHLFLFVKVREKWANDPNRYVQWGLDFDSKA